MTKRKTFYSKRYTTQKAALKEAHKIHGAMTNAEFISGQKTGYVVYTTAKRKPKKGYKSKFIDY